MPTPCPQGQIRKGREGPLPPTQPSSRGAQEDRSALSEGPGLLGDVPSFPCSPMRASMPHHPMFKGRRALVQGHGTLFLLNNRYLLVWPVLFKPHSCHYHHYYFHSTEEEIEAQGTE